MANGTSGGSGMSLASKLANYAKPLVTPYVRPYLKDYVMLGLSHVATFVASFHLNLGVCWLLGGIIDGFVESGLAANVAITFASSVAVTVALNVSHERMRTTISSIFNLENAAGWIVDHANLTMVKVAKWIVIVVVLGYVWGAVLLLDLTNRTIALYTTQYIVSTVVYEIVFNPEGDYDLVRAAIRDYRSRPTITRHSSFHFIVDYFRRHQTKTDLLHYVGNDGEGEGECIDDHETKPWREHGNDVTVEQTSVTSWLETNQTNNVIRRVKSTNQVLLSDGFVITEDYQQGFNHDT